MRFTNHNATIRFGTHDYSPSGALDGSAKQKLEGLKDRNWEAKGIITSDDITFDDLRAGKYRRAKIEDMLIDWRYPWADVFETNTYYIINTTFSGEFWTAQVEGLTHRLKIPIGRIYSRTCDVRAFGDSRCNVAGGEAAYTISGLAVSVINIPRRDFSSADLGVYNKDANWFKRGYLKFTTGACNNLTMEINKSYSGGRIKLWLPMPYNIEAGDLFNIVAGCNRSASTCHNKFDNKINFRGFDTIPGTDAMIRTPIIPTKNHGTSV